MSQEDDVKKLIEVMEGWSKLVEQIVEAVSSMGFQKETENGNLTPVSDTMGLDYKNLQPDELPDYQKKDENDLDLDIDPQNSAQSKLQ
ncbi:hypothetical protein [Legionella jamestowniensis]|uniref:Coiled-coil protein n=1 Tax=Legionella jamestowniensis TaxID=455 RepID=A0A0W0UL74_9GAMM|nr:hypothetical protein [Legionella jamestowniensis]KTD08508.1 hypothetical protein Ljam_2703 [Legionella jamestowniensis]OCH97028.1 hypothetical protein A8135_05185 [Legionella jamestowniensis]SFL52209.1 hypothetical protein SAMN02746073_0647 [Legionella jamestowniensis DSM 19215]